MKITSIQLQNLRGFQNLPETKLSETINVFIGANNSGKSTILNCIYYLQKRDSLTYKDITIGKNNSLIKLTFWGSHMHYVQGFTLSGKIQFVPGDQNPLLMDYNNMGNNKVIEQLPNHEPNNLIYPYLSKRKTLAYSDTINEQNTNSVNGNFSNLFAKIDRLCMPNYEPGYTEYTNACRKILGFEIATLAIGNGKQAVYYIYKSEHIPLTSMGEGVANILGLITDLCVADNKIFLIEEPENDIHPKALKALMELIIAKSKSNQFFVSTHSNIVMKYLGGAEGSKLFNVTNEERDEDKQNLFISTLQEVPNKPEERRKVLEALGYDFFDFDLWKGWLFLEESSAERLIRDYFIDWYVKPLRNKIKTFSAGGTSSIIPKFQDFNKLFVFLHLEPTYKNRVWVIIDAGEEEKDIIEKMKTTYTKSGWRENNFDQFDEHDFEKYYPQQFQQQVADVLAITDKQKKRDAKKALLEDVIIKWIEEDEPRAKAAFSISAAHVIEKLERICAELNN